MMVAPTAFYWFLLLSVTVTIVKSQWHEIVKTKTCHNVFLNICSYLIMFKLCIFLKCINQIVHVMLFYFSGHSGELVDPFLYQTKTSALALSWICLSQIFHKLCMTITSTELFLFILGLMILILFEGHKCVLQVR